MDMMQNEDLGPQLSPGMIAPGAMGPGSLAADAIAVGGVIADSITADRITANSVDANTITPGTFAASAAVTGQMRTDSKPRARITRKQLVDISTALDAVIVSSSFLLAITLYTVISGGALRADGNYGYVGIFTGFLYFLIAHTKRPSGNPAYPGSIGSVVKSLAMTFAIMVVMGYVLKQTEIHSRLWLALSCMVAFGLLVLKNRLWALLIDKHILGELSVEKIALYGDAAIAGPLNSALLREFKTACEVRVYGNGANGATTPAAAGGIDRLVKDGLNGGFDRIIFCLPPDRMHQVKELSEAISFLPAKVEVCLAMPELQTLRNDMLIPSDPILIKIEGGPDDAWGLLLKRIMDLVLGAFFLLALSPVMIAAAIAVKLNDGGDIFFRQRRHGWNHSIIKVWKFRSMSVQQDGANVPQAVRNDKRVTKVGRFLRKSSIDELPQLFNVLTGEMSLVGPRPHALEHNVYYSEMIDTYAARHKVRPGLTGWAQVQGLRGNSEEIAKMAARAKADIWYIRNWSIMLDLKILVMTPLVVLFQKEAL